MMSAEAAPATNNPSSDITPLDVKGLIKSLQEAVRVIATKNPSSDTTIMTPKQIVDSIPGVTMGGLRWDLYNAHSNGLAESGAILRRGKRIVIIRELYLSWHRGRR